MIKSNSLNPGNIKTGRIWLLTQYFDTSYDDIIESIRRNGHYEPVDCVAAHFNNHEHGMLDMDEEGTR